MNFRIWNYILPLIVVSVQFVPTPALFSETSSDKCEELHTGTLCNTLYNFTAFPNYLNQATQTSATFEIHQYYPLIKIGCSDKMLHFLCSVYFPECHFVDDKPTVIPPCKSVCLQVKTGCGTLMGKFGFGWPDSLDCNRVENGPHCPPLEVPFVPANINLTFELNITYNSNLTSYKSCCFTHSHAASVLNLNDLGDRIRKPVDLRTEPFIQWDKPTDTNETEGLLFSVLVIDSDVTPPLGTTNKPFLHYQVINIPNGSNDEGNVTVSYLGPAPPFGQIHNFHFLLYQQNGFLDPSTVNSYVGKNCSGSSLAGRCMFDINGVVTENGLKLVGVKKIRVQTDAYSRYIWQNIGSEFGITKDKICHDVSGYGDPCPIQGFPLFSSPNVIG